MNLIVAVDENWGIGCDGKLLTHIPEDMKFFKQKTTGKVVVMGHSTLKSLPNSKPLKDRINIVLSKNTNLVIENAIVCNSVVELSDILKLYNSNDVFVIGGQEIYKLLLPYCSHAFITKIFEKLPADKHFPNISISKEWEKVYESDVKTYENIKYIFSTYENINPISL